jgi:hypothetical protein
VASGDVQQEEKIKTAGLETSVPIRGDAMERHHSRRTTWPGSTTLVASGDVQQEEKIKTAGLETSVPLEEEPAGCQRSDKRGRHGTPPFPTHYVAGIYDSGGIGRRAAGRKDKDCRSGDQLSLREDAGSMPAFLKYNFRFN